MAKKTSSPPPLKEKSERTVGSQIRRYANVSTTVAGLATKLAGEKFFGIKIEREKHAQDLMMALGALKGPMMKVGQILSTIPEALPPEYARALSQLQSNAPPMGWPFVRRRMRSELGENWEENFKEFGREASAAASLGQVHKAETLSGEIVACKLQYPDMQSAIGADLNQLKLIFSVFESYDKAIKTKNIYDELKDRLYEELDYEREARNQKLYTYMLRDEPNVHVPEVVDELSTKRLLTSKWLDGRKILEFVDTPIEQRNQLAMNMFRAWYVPLYHYGVIHGDPHLGNYSVRDDNGINLLDFGCVRVFRPDFIGGVINLYHSLINKDEAQAVHAYETWGFKDLSKEQIEILNIWANFLYAPVMEDKIRKIGETNNGVYGRETAQKVHAKLREVGGVDVPREFVFMDRATLGVGSVFIHLKAEMNWYRIFNEMIADFDEAKLKKRQSGALKKFGLEDEVI